MAPNISRLRSIAKRMGAMPGRESTVQKLLTLLGKLNWILALIIGLIAAIVFRQGHEEIAAVIWLVSLILVLPMWSQLR